MVALTCRWWLAVCSLATAVAFKASEAPMQIVKTDNETLKKQVEEIAAKNMQGEFEDMNAIPNPANFTLNGSMQNASQGVGELGKSFEFMMLKLAQLETLCELQQLEIESLKTTVKGLAEHVDHPDSVASLVQKDEKTRMQETQQTLKRVLAKHARQHKTKEFLPTLARQGRHEAKPEAGGAERSRRADSSGPFKATGQAEAMLLQRGKTTKADTASLDSAVSAKGIPIYDDVKDFAEDRIEDVKSVAESTADAYEAAADKVAFVANTVIDTVEMAVNILLRGFTDWAADCDISGPSIRDYVDECSITGYREERGIFGWTFRIPIVECKQKSVLMALNWGRQKCWIRLMGQQITLFDFNFGSLEMAWPAPIKTAIDIGTGLSNCHGGNIFKCLGDKIVPDITWPHPIQKMINFGNAIGNCHGGNVFKCFGDKIVQVVTWPQPIQKMIGFGNAIGNCHGGNVFLCFGNKIVENVPMLNTMVSSCSGRNLFECFGTNIVEKVPPLNAMVSMGRDLASCFSGTEPVHLFKCLGTRIAENVPALGRMVTLGKDLVNCADGAEPIDLIKCFGMRLLQEVPPLSFLTRLGELLKEFLGHFTKYATSVVKTAMDKGLSFVQTAATSAFPEVGAPPAVHHAGKNLIVKTHSQPGYHGSKDPGAKVPKRTAVLQTGANASRAGGDDDSDAAITFKVGPYGPETTGLITQFEGKETDTGSCLAFAPRTKTGSGNQATKGDWVVDSNDKFLQLEPWAVPCDNTWMQRNWDKWQGYTFYMSKSNIEKCVTVTFAVGLQPVAAFVGGIQFDVLPTPFFEFDTQICWPKHHPGGVDISALRFEMRTMGILLFGRTLRLTKRFGDGTDFQGSNIDRGIETFRSQLGLEWGSDFESSSGMNKMSRTPKLLQTNKTTSQDEKAEEEGAMQWVDAEELYLASAEYGPELFVNKTSELRGPAAHRRLSALQQSKESHKLFRFKHPGMVSFALEGLYTDGVLELGVQMGFGPFESPSTKIPLVNIVDQFSSILKSLPFISSGSRGKAEEALRDFEDKNEDKLEKGMVNEVLFQPADPSSMVAWFKSEDAGPEWPSAVGTWKGRVTKGSVTEKVEVGNGANKPVRYLSGNTHAGYDFGKVMKPDFTICSVTRYLQGGKKSRILTNKDPNFVHGHWHDRAGLAHYKTWVTSYDVPSSTDWLVMCGNNKQVVMAGNERRNIATGQSALHSADFNLYINEGFEQEFSDFGVMEIITWNRALSEDEMWTSMEYLNSKLQAPADPSSMVAWFKSEDAGPKWPSVVGTWKGRVTKGSITEKVEAGNGANKPVRYLSGNTHAGYDFGKIMKPDFTICSITRYLKGGKKSRVLTNINPNFLHGHWHDRAGLAHYKTWVTSPHVASSTDWLVMCGNNKQVVMAGNERRNIATQEGVLHETDFNLYINEGFTAEFSDFGVMEIITWNRALSEDEMWTSMEYLNSKLQVAGQVCPGLPMGDRFIQLGLGEWRLGEHDESHFSISHKDGWTAQIFRSDGTLHPGLGVSTCLHPNLLSHLFGAELPIGAFRIGTIDNIHLSVAHKGGKTAQIFRNDGHLFPGPRGDYGTYGRPSALSGISEGDRYLQIGQFRLGDVDGQHFTVIHTGKTIQIYRGDGTLHPGLMTDD
ncbi:unnamed protein product [Symbiodinium sp. CCMP2592]|nr:unnamed protein product [Symbiodinium sp. CCMP2592]